jgi:hypothetical protein
MVLFSLMMMWAFPWKEYKDLHEPGSKLMNPLPAYWQAINYWDFIKEGGSGIKFLFDFLRGKPGTRASHEKQGFDVEQAFLGDAPQSDATLPLSEKRSPSLAAWGSRSEEQGAATPELWAALEKGALPPGASAAQQYPTAYQASPATEGNPASSRPPDSRISATPPHSVPSVRDSRYPTASAAQEYPRPDDDTSRDTHLPPAEQVPSPPSTEYGYLHAADGPTDLPHSQRNSAVTGYAL